MPDPPAWTAYLFKEQLQKKGLDVAGASLTMAEAFEAGVRMEQTRKRLVTHQSPPLKTLVQYTNQKSINLFAESLLKAIGVQSLSLGTTKAGTEACKKYWEMLGVDLQSAFIKDGSGLSPANGLSATHFAQMLTVATTQPWYSDFLTSLPVAGQSGTLRNMCKGQPATGRVKAKSGTLTNVMCYTGYVTATSGQKYTFAILINNYSGSYYAMRNEVEKLFNAMAGS